MLLCKDDHIPAVFRSCRLLTWIGFAHAWLTAARALAPCEVLHVLCPRCCPWPSSQAHSSGNVRAPAESAYLCDGDGEVRLPLASIIALSKMRLSAKASKDLCES